MPVTAEWVRVYYHMRNMRPTGRVFVLDLDTAIRVFRIHDDQFVQYIRAVLPWEDAYVEIYERAIRTNVHTVFLCPTPATTVH
jgi:hypothetical protein